MTSRSLLIDTNILVLLIVGETNRLRIGRHKRTRTFAPEDHATLLNVLDSYDELWITSHCYAEASNLLRQTDAAFSYQLSLTLLSLAHRVRESHFPISVIREPVVAARLGVADAGFVHKAKSVTAFLTTDFRLYTEVSRRYGNAINFNHLRFPES